MKNISKVSKYLVGIIIVLSTINYFNISFQKDKIKNEIHSFLFMRGGSKSFPVKATEGDDHFDPTSEDSDVDLYTSEESIFIKNREYFSCSSDKRQIDRTYPSYCCEYKEVAYYSCC